MLLGFELGLGVFGLGRLVRSVCRVLSGVVPVSLVYSLTKLKNTLRGYCAISIHFTITCEHACGRCFSAQMHITLRVIYVFGIRPAV